MSLPYGISFCPTALTRCTSVTDIQTDRPRYGNICRNRWNHFPQCHLVVIIVVMVVLAAAAAAAAVVVVVVVVVLLFDFK